MKLNDEQLSRILSSHGANANGFIAEDVCLSQYAFCVEDCKDRRARCPQRARELGQADKVKSFYQTGGQLVETGQ